MKPGVVFALVSMLMARIADVRAGEFQAGAALRIITPNPLLPVSGGGSLRQFGTISAGISRDRESESGNDCFRGKRQLFHSQPISAISWRMVL